MSVFPNQCVHRTLFQHHWASCTKAAQRQMGNFLRGKKGRRGGGEKNLERQQKKRQDVCLCLLFQRATEWKILRRGDIYRLWEREREKKKQETGWENTGKNETKGIRSLSLSLSFSEFFSSTFSIRILLLCVCEYSLTGLSLHSILIRDVFSLSSFPHHWPNAQPILMAGHRLAHLTTGFLEEASRIRGQQTHNSPSVFIPGDDVSDKELEGCGRGGGGE